MALQLVRVHKEGTYAPYSSPTAGLMQCGLLDSGLCQSVTSIKIPTKNIELKTHDTIGLHGLWGCLTASRAVQNEAAVP